MNYQKNLIFIICCLFSVQGLSLSIKDSLEIAKKRCTSSEPNFTKTPRFTNSLFTTWHLDLEKMRQFFNLNYQAPNRVSLRVYYDPKKSSFILPILLHRNKMHIETITLKDNFIINTILHVETALKQNYADYINFSDMGHSHFFIPQDYYNKEILNMESKDMHKAYEKIFSHKETKFLYHTAEQLDMNIQKTKDKKYILPKDPYLNYRYLNRNIIGDNKQTGHIDVVQNKNLQSEYNTVRKLDGHRFWGAGLYMDSNQKACFPYRKKDKIYYFDISMNRP